jgi:hypothetical protein
VIAALLAAGLVAPSDVGSSASAETAKVRVIVTGAGSVRSVGSNSISCPTRCSTTVPVGVTLSLKATPQKGVFADWRGGCTGRALRCDLVVEATTSVAVNFPGSASRGVPFRLRVTSSGKGVVQSDAAGVIACPPKCSDTLSSGTLTLTPKASADSEFVRWGGDCSGTSPCRLRFGTTGYGTTPKVLEVTATFRRGSIPTASSQLTVTNDTPPPQSLVGAGTVFVASSECKKTRCTYTFSNGTLLTLRGNVDSGGFSSWDGACRGRAIVCRLIVDGPQTVKAAFSTGTPLDTSPGLNIILSGKGRVESLPKRIGCGSGGDCSAAFEGGEKVKLTASTSSPWKFANWGIDCLSRTAIVNSNVCSVPVVEGTTVSATFRLIRDELQIARAGDGKGVVTSDRGGIACGTSCSKTFVRGETVKLHAEPAQGSTFGGWSGPCSGRADCPVTMSQDKVVVIARFDLIRDRVQVRKTGNGGGTVTSTPAGIACGASCEAPFAHGSRVTLHATPDSDSRFAGWSGACSGKSGCSFAVTGPKTVTARFERLRDGVTVQKLGKGTGAVSSSPAGIACGDRCTAPFPRGTEVVLTATPTGGSKFAGWSGRCSGMGPCTVTVNGPTVVGARFTRICVAAATTGFRASVARAPRRVVVHVRVAGPVTARLRLFRGPRRLAQKVVSLTAGDRQVRLDVPRGAARGTYRIGVRIADVCGGSKVFSKQLSVPR